MHWPWRAAMFKTLYRNDGTYAKLGVHSRARPIRNGRRRALVRWGRPRAGRPVSHPADLLAVRAFQLRTGAAQPLSRSARWRVSFSRPIAAAPCMPTCARWITGSSATGATPDRHDPRPGGKGRGERAALSADPVLAHLHDGGRRWRQTRFEALMRGRTVPRALCPAADDPADAPGSARGGAGTAAHHAHRGRADDGAPRRCKPPETARNTQQLAQFRPKPQAGFSQQKGECAQHRPGEDGQSHAGQDADISPPMAGCRAETGSTPGRSGRGAWLCRTAGQTHAAILSRKATRCSSPSRRFPGIEALSRHPHAVRDRDGPRARAGPA